MSSRYGAYSPYAKCDPMQCSNAMHHSFSSQDKSTRL